MNPAETSCEGCRHLKPAKNVRGPVAAAVPYGSYPRRDRRHCAIFGVLGPASIVPTPRTSTCKEGA